MVRRRTVKSTAVCCGVETEAMSEMVQVGRQAGRGTRGFREKAGSGPEPSASRLGSRGV